MSTSPITPKNYRPDIDGLRAVAVLSVIIFHINESLLPGGFVGVDIFFVISGYLITQHILRDLDKQRFSIAEFYRRRVKRIMPAMLVVVFVTLIAAQQLLLPRDAEEVAESALWSVLSMANVYFWLFEDTSYFAAASQEKPLLHLWSLGVEEQFYIFWPLMLMLAYKLHAGRNFFLSLVLIAFVSFIAGEYFYSHAPSFVYYMLPTRAGELLVGALLAKYLLKRPDYVPSDNLAFICSLLGWVLIVASLFLLSEHDVFPGLKAIPPTLGAALLIFSGGFSTSALISCLKLKPMVFVGLISYSAYLWHWPLLAFYRYGYGDISATAGVVLFTVTLLCAWLSYRFVEIPFRQSEQSALTVIIRQFALPSFVIIFLSLASMKLDGYGFRWLSQDYKNTLTTLRDANKPAYRYDYVCQSQVITLADASDPKCIVGETHTGQSTDILLWGDSNAAHYIGIIGAFAHAEKFSFRNLQIGSCPPVKSDPAPFATAKRLADCRQSQAITFETLAKYDTIIVSANWTFYDEQSNGFYEQFFTTLRDLVRDGKRIIIIGKAPVLETYDRKCREKAISFPAIRCEYPNAPLAQKVIEANARLKSFADQEDNIEYADFNAYICPQGTCNVLDENGDLNFYDASHLTLNASWKIGEAIIKEHGVPYPFNTLARSAE